MSDSRRSRTSSRSSDVSTSSTLTRAEIENVLESPVQTGYTYSVSRAYKRSGSTEFTHPRMGRRPITFRNPKFMPMEDLDVTTSVGRYSSDRYYYQQPLRRREGYAQFWAWLLHLLQTMALVTFTTVKQLGVWILDRPLASIYKGLSYSAGAVRDAFFWLLRLPVEGIYYLLSRSSAAVEKGQELGGWVLDKPLAAMYGGARYGAVRAWDSFVWLLRLPMEGIYYLRSGFATTIEKGWTMDKLTSTLYNGASYIAGKIRDVGIFVLQLPAHATEVTRYFSANRTPKRTAERVIVHEEERTLRVGPYAYERQDRVRKTPYALRNRGTHVAHYDKTTEVTREIKPVRDWSSFWYFWLPLLLALLLGSLLALPKSRGNWTRYEQPCDENAVECAKQWVYNKAAETWEYLPNTPSLEDYSFAHYLTGYSTNATALGRARTWAYRQGSNLSNIASNVPHKLWTFFVDIAFRVIHVFSGVTDYFSDKMGDPICTAKEIAVGLLKLPLRAVQFFLTKGHQLGVWILDHPLASVYKGLGYGAYVVRDSFFWLLRLPMEATRYFLSGSAAVIEKGQKLGGRVIEKPVTAVYNSVSHGAGAVRDGFVWLLRQPMEGIYYLRSGSAAAIEKVWDAVIWTLNAPLVVLDKTGGLVADGVKAAYNGGRNALRTIPTGMWWILRQARDFGEWIVNIPLRLLYWVGGHAIAGMEKGKDLAADLLKLPLRAVQFFLNGCAWIIEKGQQLGVWILDRPLASIFKGLSYGAGAVRDAFSWLIRLPMKAVYYFLSGSAAAIEKGQNVGGWVLDKPVTAIYNGASHGAGAVRDGFVWLLRLPMEGMYYLLSGSAAAIEKGQQLGGWMLDKPISVLYDGASYVAGKVRDAGVFVFQLPVRALYFLLSGSAAAIEKGQQIGGWLLDHPLYYLQASGNKVLGGGYWVADSVRGLGHYFVRSFARFVLSIGRFFSGGGSTERPRTVVSHEERYKEKESESYQRGASEKQSESYHRGASEKDSSERLEGVTEDHPIVLRLQRMFYSLLNEQNDHLEKRLRSVIEEKVGGVRTDFDSQMLHLRDSYEEQMAHLQKELIEKHNAAVKDEMGKLLGIIREEISAKSFNEQEQGKSLEVAVLRDEINALKAQLAEKSKGLESGIEQRVENIILQLNQQQENRFKIYQAQMEKKVGTETGKPDHLVALARIQSEIDTLKDELKSVGLAATNAQAAADIAVGLDAKIAAILDKLMSSERKAIQLELEQLEKRMSEKTSKANATAATGTVPKKGTDAEVEKKLAEFMSSVNERITTQSSKLLDELQVIRRNYNEHKLEVAHEHHLHLDDDALISKFRAIVKEALDRYDMDKTGLPDYALESSGGAVVSTRCTVQYKETSRRESILGFPLWYSSYSPRSVIQRKTHGATPGECWAFVGGQGYLTVRLSKRLNVTAVAYEHLPVQMSPEGHINTAPKDFLVWSYQHENDLESKFFLGSFTYDAGGDALQMFAMQHVDPKGTPVIELETLNNYGAPVTCLYRFRVHGNLTQTQP